MDPRPLLPAQGEVDTAASLLALLPAREQDTRGPAHLFAQGLVHYYRGDLERALSCLSACLREHPEAQEWRTRVLGLRGALQGGARAARGPGGHYDEAYQVGEWPGCDPPTPRPTPPAWQWTRRTGWSAPGCTTPGPCSR